MGEDDEQDLLRRVLRVRRMTEHAQRELVDTVLDGVQYRARGTLVARRGSADVLIEVSGGPFVAHAELETKREGFVTVRRVEARVTSQ